MAKSSKRGAGSEELAVHFDHAGAQSPGDPPGPLEILSWAPMARVVGVTAALLVVSLAVITSSVAVFSDTAERPELTVRYS